MTHTHLSCFLRPNFLISLYPNSISFLPIHNILFDFERIFEVSLSSFTKSIIWFFSPKICNNLYTEWPKYSFTILTFLLIIWSKYSFEIGDLLKKKSKLLLLVIILLHRYSSVLAEKWPILSLTNWPNLIFLKG